MIRQTIGALSGWILVLFFLAALMFFQYHTIIFMILVMWIIIPFLTAGINIFGRKDIHISVEAKPSISKKERLTVKLTVDNKGYLPFLKILCGIIVNNRLTGEVENIYLPVYAFPKGRSSKDFHITSGYCGYMDIKVEKIYFMDWIGFLWSRGEESAKAHSSILPDTFPTQIYFNLSGTEKEDAEQWSSVRKGNDRSEVFSMRDYVMGDSIRQIHWKVSANKGQLIVKEGSFPIESALLIYWNKNLREALAEEMDVMAEAVSSICQSMIQQGVNFFLGWTEGNEEVYEYIDSEEQLLQIIPRMLKHGFYSAISMGDRKKGYGVHTNFIKAQYDDRYSKVIYFASILPEDREPFQCEDVTFFVCNVEGEKEEPGVISFGIDNYMEVLQYIEI